MAVAEGIKLKPIHQCAPVPPTGVAESAITVSLRHILFASATVIMAGDAFTVNVAALEVTVKHPFVMITGIDWCLALCNSR